MTYKQGIPTEPGMYWYRETLEMDAEILELHDIGAVSFMGSDQYCYPDEDKEGFNYLESCFFCPAIPPEVNDE